MVVVVAVSSADEMMRDAVTEEDAEDSVLGGVGLILIECDEDEGVVHEMLVLQKRSKEGLQPDTSNGN